MENHLEKLERLNMGKMTRPKTHDQLTAALKVSIQQSNACRLRQTREAAAADQRAHTEEKLSIAAARRKNRGPAQPYYSFTSDAFGDNARDFDLKYHAISVDRRDATWQRHHQRD